MATPTNPIAEAVKPRREPKERMMALIAGLEDAQRQGSAAAWNLRYQGLSLNVPSTAAVKAAVRCGNVTVVERSGEGYAEDVNESFSPRPMAFNGGMDPGAVAYNGYLLSLIMIDDQARGRTWQWRQIEALAWISGAYLALSILDDPDGLERMMMGQHPRSYGLAFEVARDLMRRAGTSGAAVTDADLGRLYPRWMDRRLGSNSTLGVRLDGLGRCAPY